MKINQEFQKNIYICFIDYKKPLCQSWQAMESPRRSGVPTHLLKLGHSKKPMGSG